MSVVHVATWVGSSSVPRMISARVEAPRCRRNPPTLSTRSPKFSCSSKLATCTCWLDILIAAYFRIPSVTKLHPYTIYTARCWGLFYGLQALCLGASTLMPFSLLHHPLHGEEKWLNSWMQLDFSPGVLNGKRYCYKPAVRILMHEERELEDLLRRRFWIVRCFQMFDISNKLVTYLLSQGKRVWFLRTTYHLESQGKRVWFLRTTYPHGGHSYPFLNCSS